jgi:uncharacterized protein DUF4342
MTVKTAWETFKVEGGELLDRVKEIVAQGNARSIVIKQDGRRIAEFPLTIGVVGAVFAPVLAAVGALAAVLSKCTIEVERVVPESKSNGTAAAKKSTRSRRSSRG